MDNFFKTAWKIAAVLGVALFMWFAPHLNSIFQRMLNPNEVKTPEQMYEDFLANNSPAKNPSEMPTGEVVTVLLSPPQYVYFCFEQADLSTLLLAPTIVEARAWFERFRIPDKTGLPRCDYLVNNDTLEYVKVSRLENLRQVPTRLAGPPATPLPPSGAVYQGSDGDRDYYVYLASASLSSAVRFLKYDFITAAFGQQP
jgi:hypothetical protein